MPAYKEEKLSSFTVTQLFNMVADIESYPIFLPWCSGARILKNQIETKENIKNLNHENYQHSNIIYAELIIHFKSFQERYTSRVILTPPNQDQSTASIEVQMVEGPFEFLNNKWKFIPTDNGTMINFSIDFKFKSSILEKLIGMLFTTAVEKMVKAFETRAKDLYQNI